MNVLADRTLVQGEAVSSLNSTNRPCVDVDLVADLVYCAVRDLSQSRCPSNRSRCSAGCADHKIVQVEVHVQVYVQVSVRATVCVNSCEEAAVQQSLFAAPQSIWSRKVTGSTFILARRIASTAERLRIGVRIDSVFAVLSLFVAMPRARVKPAASSNARS